MDSSDNKNHERHLRHEPLTHFSFAECGCIARGDGVKLTWCRFHNPQTGTHAR